MTQGNVYIWEDRDRGEKRTHLPFQTQPEERGHDPSPQPPLQKEKEQSWLNLGNSTGIKPPDLNSSPFTMSKPTSLLFSSSLAI